MCREEMAKSTSFLKRQVEDSNLLVKEKDRVIEVLSPSTSLYLILIICRFLKMNLLPYN